MKRPKIPDWARWIARDEDGSLAVFRLKPEKQIELDSWNAGGVNEEVYDPEDYFSLVKWEDKEPHPVFPITKEDYDLIEEDNVNKPTHYHKNGIDVIGFSEAQFSKEEQKGFHRINAIKYITRYDRKNGVEDLRKAKFYIDKLIEMEESE